MEHKKDCKYKDSNIPYNECPCDCFITVEKAILKNTVDILNVLLDDFKTLRDKCLSYDEAWTLKTDDCFQYRAGRGLVKHWRKNLK